MKDRWLVHAIINHEERARIIALAVRPFSNPLSVEQRHSWNGTTLNVYDVVGVLDGTDLSLFTSLICGYRESLTLLEVNRVIAEA